MVLLSQLLEDLGLILLLTAFFVLQSGNLILFTAQKFHNLNTWWPLGLGNTIWPSIFVRFLDDVKSTHDWVQYPQFDQGQRWAPCHRTYVALLLRSWLKLRLAILQRSWFQPQIWKKMRAINFSRMNNQFWMISGCQTHPSCQFFFLPFCSWGTGFWLGAPLLWGMNFHQMNDQFWSFGQTHPRCAFFLPLSSLDTSVWLGAPPTLRDEL